MRTKKNKQVTVLGIHDGHNSGAALIRDGKVLAAISEERLNNIKNYTGTPVLSIKKVFDIANIKPEEVDLIAVGCFVRIGDPLRVENNLVHTLQEYVAPILHAPWAVKLIVKFFHLFRGGKESLYSVLKGLGIKNKRLIFIEHHLTHAASAYYQRPWNSKALILTLDGMGDGLSATVSVGEGFKIRRIAQTSYYDSLSNNLYSEITGYLGLKRWEHEYKVMGLAPYGKSKYVIDSLRNIVRINPNKPLEFENISGKYLKRLQPLYKKILTEQRFDNIAAATQQIFEELVVQWVKNATKETKINDIICSGGAFLNVKANKLIREIPEVNRAFFYPAASDGGTPVGTALEGYYRYCNENTIQARRVGLTDLCYGQDFSDDEIWEFLKYKKLTRKARKTTAKKVARLLSEGKIIARFSGRDEFGPRALGNRSIMADPRSMNMISKINFAIKQRDFWMPFAVSILESDKAKYFKGAKQSPYMIEAFDTKPSAIDLIAGLHPQDMTARPQTVNNKWNPGWHDIITEFKKITGVGGILNTSFNLHGYPIVGSPERAYETFQKSALDGLLLNNWLIMK